MKEFMKEMAAYMIVGYAAMLIIVRVYLGVSGQASWSFIRSEASGICYERLVNVGLLNISQSLNPVDSKYCEED